MGVCGCEVERRSRSEPPSFILIAVWAYYVKFYDELRDVKRLVLVPLCTSLQVFVVKMSSVLRGLSSEPPNSIQKTGDLRQGHIFFTGKTLILPSITLLLDSLRCTGTIGTHHLFSDIINLPVLGANVHYTSDWPDTTALVFTSWKWRMWFWAGRTGGA